ncbi:unnamed protein product [Hapterophycus canaliculatus]
MKLPLRTLVFAVVLCFRAAQAFVPSLKTQPCRRALPTRASARTTTAAGRRWKGRRDAREFSGLFMFFGRGRQPPPQLSEDDLAAMTKARDEASDVEVEAFMEKMRAEKEARRQAEKAEQRKKLASRIQAEKEDAEHKKVYIPQRLEEIEREEAVLKDRVSAFNTKIKDKEIKEL